MEGTLPAAVHPPEQEKRTRGAPPERRARTRVLGILWDDMLLSADGTDHCLPLRPNARSMDFVAGWGRSLPGSQTREPLLDDPFRAIRDLSCRGFARIDRGRGLGEHLHVTGGALLERRDREPVASPSLGRTRAAVRVISAGRRPIRQRLLKPRVRVRSEPLVSRAARSTEFEHPRGARSRGAASVLHAPHLGKRVDPHRTRSFVPTGHRPDGDELARPSRCENCVLANATRFTWRLLTRAGKLSRVRPTRPGYRKKTSLLCEVLCTRGQKQVIMVVRPNG